MLSARGVLPPYRYPQGEITEAVVRMVGVDGVRAEALRRVHANAGVRRRATALPLDRYAALDSFDAANDAFIDAAVSLGARAVREAVDAAGVMLEDVDLLVGATVTGLAVPSIDARVAAALGMRDDLKRLPVVGLGCVAGAAGVARVNDYLRGRPSDVAVLLSVELCSLTLQRGDTSAANIVASGLFGDGAAAVVLAGPQAPARGSIEVIESRSRLYPGTERAMGWDIGSNGLRIVLGAEVPDLIRANLAADVTSFLADQGLRLADIAWWVAHPGGPKVLEAMQAALDVPRDAFEITWRSLAEIGNVSSASVLNVLADTLRERHPAPGSLGLMMAMGPGFCAELVLLRAVGGR